MAKPKALKFEAHPDKGDVSALLLKPANSKHLLVLGHGAGAGMTHSNMEEISQALYRNGIASLRYQFPYMERGGGRDARIVTLTTIQNAVRAARKLAPKYALFAGGHSFGGRMTSHASAEDMIEDVKGLVFCSFPLHTPKKPGVERAEHLPQISIPMLFLSGTRDDMMDFELFKPVLKKLGKKAKLHPLDTANHGYKILKRTRSSEEDVFSEIGRVASEWIRAV